MVPVGVAEPAGGNNVFRRIPAPFAARQKMFGGYLQVVGLMTRQPEFFDKTCLVSMPHRLATIETPSALRRVFQSPYFRKFLQFIPPMTGKSLWYAPAVCRPEAGELMLAY